jgi:hypothetical protein
MARFPLRGTGERSSGRAHVGRRIVFSAVLFGSAVAAVTSEPVAAAVAGDGTTAATAGASCWGIKQQVPAAASGLYYLQTPRLVEPRQVYCDMVTDGGGWVLIGRGMQGWTWAEAGQAVTNVASNPTGLTPAALPSEQVNGLLNGATVASLTDGVRLRRAANPTGTSFQEVRMFLGQQGAWQWGMHNGYRVTNLVVNGTQLGASGTTRDTFGDNGLDTKLGVAGNGRNDATRIWTSQFQNSGYRMGFGMGAGTGTGSHWYNPNSKPVPWTQVYIRPKIANGLTYPALATAAPRFQVPIALKNSAELAPWGVYGRDVTGQVSTADPQKATVFAIAQQGDRMFVGGSFTHVRNGPTATPISRPFLAAFDLNGNWISTFAPTLNGRVWDLLPSPDGKLFVSGDFTSINGDTLAGGIAKIDPITGQVVTNFRSRATLNGGRGLVRTMDLQGSILYFGGSFNRVFVNNWDSQVANTASVDLSQGTTGKLAPWRPVVNGVVFDIDASAQGDRVYIAGWFTKINNLEDLYYATSASTGATLTNFKWIRTNGTGLTCCAGRYSQYVEEVGNVVWIGHREHTLAAFDRTTGARLQQQVAYSGGDHQAIVQKEGTIWAACHCGQDNYQGGIAWPISTIWQRRARLNLVGQYDSATQNHFEGFWPSVGSDTGDGPWEVTFDSKDCQWWGGDLDRRAWSGNAATDYVGEFMRFCPEVDRSVATTPGQHTATAQADGTVKLTWGASSDASNDVKYLIYRDGKVIAVVSGTTTFTDTGLTAGPHQYAVQAVDAVGNRSKSTNPTSVTVTLPGPTQPTTLIAAGATWKWLYPAAAQAPAASWKTSAFNDGAWAAGPAELGYGDGDEATVIPSGASPRNVSAYFRNLISVSNPGAYSSVTFTVKRDDGVVLYLNGVELGRNGMPSGTIANTTLANVEQSSATQEATTWSVTIPAANLVAGQNLIAAEVHQFSTGSSDVSFRLTAVANP